MNTTQPLSVHQGWAGGNASTLGDGGENQSSLSAFLSSESPPGILLSDCSSGLQHRAPHTALSQGSPMGRHVIPTTCH